MDRLAASTPAYRWHRKMLLLNAQAYNKHGWQGDNSCCTPKERCLMQFQASKLVTALSQQQMGCVQHILQDLW